jgi:hypothetical protein
VERNRRIRVLISRIGIVLAVGASALVTLAGPAAAHHPILDGHEVCDSGGHRIVWTISNSESAPSRTMRLEEVRVFMNGVNYTITGFSSTVAPSGLSTEVTPFNT